MVLITRRCLCLHSGTLVHWAACNDSTLSHYFCTCDVSDRNSIFFTCPHILSCPHTLTEDVMQSKCPGRPSQLDTPEQWCFPLPLMEWRVFQWLIVFALLTILPLSSHSINLSHLCHAWSFSLSLFYSLLSIVSFYHLHTTYMRIVIIRKAMNPC